jgi:hypothetical protein
MTDAIRAYVNGRGIDVPAGATALEAVRAADPAVAEAVLSGVRALTDSRGLPIDPSEVLVAGSILRVVSVRRRNGPGA